MAEKETPAFTPLMSRRSSTLETLTNEQIFNRYIEKIPAGQTYEYGNCFNSELNVQTAQGVMKYQFLTSMVGICVNLLGTTLSVRNNPFLPEGYKLNMTNIFTDIEKIFEDNRSKVKEAVDTQTITPFVRGVFEYMSHKINSSYTLNDDATYKIDN